MKKSNFIALILGTIGVVFFALGMCMALLPEWGDVQSGSNLRRNWTGCFTDYGNGLEKDGGESPH